MTVFVIRDTLAQQTYDVTSTFTSCILNYLNNRFHCSPNNSLLSFSANDWLKFVAAILNFNSAPDWLKFQVAILDLENIRFHSSPNNCLLPFSAPDWLKFQVAILDLENNRFHCSLNNSLLSFSAPDWLLPKPSPYTTNNPNFLNNLICIMFMSYSEKDQKFEVAVGKEGKKRKVFLDF